MAEELQLKYNGNDPTHGFTLQLILLPALKVACDEMRRTRCNRRLQGRGNGVPDVRAEAFMRPPERHRPLPPGTVEEWAERYVQSGSGQLSTEAAASHAVDKLTHFYEGATSRFSAAVAYADASPPRPSGETLDILQAWRADCLNAEIPPPEQLWADIRKGRYEAPLRAVWLAHLVTEQLCAAAPVMRGEVTAATYEGEAPCADTGAIRAAIARELLRA